jgi:hypothetical protein
MLMLTLMLSALAGPPAAPPGAVDQEILVMREQAWRAWYGGDVKTLEALLPADFLGIAGSGNTIADRAATIAASRSFHDQGGRIVRLAFPETQEQRVGDSVILYGRYEITYAVGGTETTLSGRLTEMFVRRAGRWWHSGWHLDVQPVGR